MAKEPSMHEAAPSTAKDILGLHKNQTLADALAKPQFINTSLGGTGKCRQYADTSGVQDTIPNTTLN